MPNLRNRIIERREMRVGDIAPAPWNPKTHPEIQAERMQAVLDEFGIGDTLKAFYADDGKLTLFDGHLRQGLDADQVWPVDITDYSEEEAKRLVLYYDPMAALAERHEERWKDIASSFEERNEALAGWLEEMGKERNEAAPVVDVGAQVDKAAELQEVWQTELGQIWELGEHRLACGDCTDSVTVRRVMGGAVPAIAINDPPYGMRLDADFSGMVNNLKFAQEKGVKSGRKYDNVIGDHEDFDAAIALSFLSDTPEQFWFGADYYSSTLEDTMHNGCWLVWDKRLDESADKMFGSCFELIWSKKKHKRDILRHKWASIFGTEKEPQRGRQHPNQKPLVLIEDLLNRYSESGQIVADFYAGSGTTLIACERLNRKCRAIEIEPKYVAVALQRYQDATGKTPQLVTQTGNDG